MQSSLCQVEQVDGREGSKRVSAGPAAARLIETRKAINKERHPIFTMVSSTLPGTD